MNSLRDAFRVHRYSEAATLVELLTSDKVRYLADVGESNEMIVLLNELDTSEEIKFHVCRIAGDKRPHEKFGTSISPMHSMKWIGERLEGFSKEEQAGLCRAFAEMVKFAGLQEKEEKLKKEALKEVGKVGVLA